MIWWAGGGVLVPGKALMASLCPTHPRQLDHKHTYILMADSCSTSHVHYYMQHTDELSLILHMHMVYQTCSITHTQTHPTCSYTARLSSHLQGASPSRCGIWTFFPGTQSRQCRLCPSPAQAFKYGGQEALVRESIPYKVEAASHESHRGSGVPLGYKAPSAPLSF